MIAQPLSLRNYTETELQGESRFMRPELGPVADSFRDPLGRTGLRFDGAGRSGAVRPAGIDQPALGGPLG